MRYCGFCGTPSQGGAFCSNCGQPFPGEVAQPPAPPPVSQPTPPPATPTPDPMPQPAQQPVPSGDPFGQPVTPQQPPAPAYAPQAPRPAASNPFAGVPIGDYVRDGAALLLLLVSLALPWDFVDGSPENTGGRWWAAIAVLIALASLALPYVHKAGVVPGWTRRHVTLFKLVAFVPLAVSVVAALVNELVNVDDFSEGGLGTGLAMALAGGLLALQPRAEDEDPTGREDSRWLLAARVAAAAALVLGIGTWLAFLLDDILGEGFLFDDIVQLLIVVTVLAAVLVIVGIPVVTFLQRSATGRRVLATVGFSTLLLAVLSEATDNDPFVVDAIEKWNTPGAGLFMLAAAAALVVSRPVKRHTAAADEARSWTGTASLAVTVAGVGLLIVGVRQILFMVEFDRTSAEWIIPAVLTFLGGGLLFFARTLLAALGRTRPTTLGVLGGVILLGIITTAVSGDSFYPIEMLAFASWFALPGLALYALTVPAAVRHAFGPLFAEREGDRVGGQPAPGHPQQPPAPAAPAAPAAQPVAPEQWQETRQMPQPPQAWTNPPGDGQPPAGDEGRDGGAHRHP